VRVERDDHGVALVLLDRPPVNALNAQLLTEIAEVAEQLAADAAVKAVVLAGEGRAFAAGADIAEFPDAAAAREVPGRFRRAGDALGAIPRPVIATLHGWALGGGLEIALACDLRIADAKTKVGQPEILLGIVPGGGASQRLARLIGPARTKELIWSGRQVEADEALALGIIDRVVADGDVREAALAWAREFASGAVVAMGLAKSAVDRGLDTPLADGLDFEATAFNDAFATDDAGIGVQSFLADGPGKAEFRGR
jgi:enoyl-CoA hydratase/carnithine racemase